MRMLLDNSLLVSLVAIAGLWLAWIAKRERELKNFKEVVAVEVLLLVQRASDLSSLGQYLTLRRIPDRRWGWWSRRWAELRAFPRWPVRHYRFMLLVQKPDALYEVVLIWESAQTRREAINRVLVAYAHEPLAPDFVVRDDTDHIIVPLEPGNYLVVEPAGWWRLRRWLQSRKRHRASASAGTSSDSSQSRND